MSKIQRVAYYKTTTRTKQWRKLCLCSDHSSHAFSSSSPQSYVKLTRNQKPSLLWKRTKEGQCYILHFELAQKCVCLNLPRTLLVDSTGVVWAKDFIESVVLHLNNNKWASLVSKGLYNGTFAQSQFDFRFGCFPRRTCLANKKTKYSFGLEEISNKQDKKHQCSLS